MLNVGGLGWIADHYRLNTTGNEKNEEYQDAMGFALIPAELLGETGEAQYPDIVLFADTLEVTTSDNLQSYFSAECAYLIVEQSVNGQGNSYKLQSRGPVVGEDDSTNPRFYVSLTRPSSGSWVSLIQASLCRVRLLETSVGISVRTARSRSVSL